METLSFPAQVYKVQTLTDGGLRVTLDLPEDAIPQGAMLMEIRRQGIPIVVEVKADEETNKTWRDQRS